MSMEHFDIFADLSIHESSKLSKKTVNESMLQFVYNDIVNGIFYLHNLNLAHCDIKPQNILMQNDRAKLTDFGSVAFCNSDYNSNLSKSNPSDNGTSTS